MIPAPLPAASGAGLREPAERPWSLDEVGATALELGLYPELQPAAEPA